MNRRSALTRALDQAHLFHQTGGLVAASVGAGLVACEKARAATQLEVPVFIDDRHDLKISGVARIKSGSTIEQVLNLVARRRQVEIDILRDRRWSRATKGEQLAQLGRWRNDGSMRRRDSLVQPYRFWTIYIGPSHSATAEGLVRITPQEILSNSNNLLLGPGVSVSTTRLHPIPHAEGRLITPQICLVYNHPDEPYPG